VHTQNFYVKMPQECGQLVKDDGDTAVDVAVVVVAAVVVMLLPENLSQI